MIEEVLMVEEVGFCGWKLTAGSGDRGRYRRLVIPARRDTGRAISQQRWSREDKMLLELQLHGYCKVLTASSTCRKS